MRSRLAPGPQGGKPVTRPTPDPIGTNERYGLRPVRSWRACRVSTAGSAWTEDVVAAELPLALEVNGLDLATIACTPTDLEDLVVGFLTSEGILCPGDPVARLEVDAGAGRAVVEVPGRSVDAREIGRPVVGSCCGKSRLGFYFEADPRSATPVESSLVLDTARCVRLMAGLQRANPVFAATGGVHTAALAGPEGLQAVRIDIGRHNALDKLYGHALRRGWSLADRVVAFSGRMSSEIVLKVARMGVPVLLSRSAPTDLALRLAETLGITAVGFLRGTSMNVYTHPERVDDLPPSCSREVGSPGGGTRLGGRRAARTVGRDRPPGDGARSPGDGARSEG